MPTAVPQTTVCTTDSSQQKSTFSRFNQRYSTALTATLGIVTCVSGVMLFFHAYKAQITALHEWLGMGFVVATVLHLIRHWKPFSHLVQQRRAQILTLIVVLITAWFVVAAGGTRRENPMRQAGQTISQMSRAPITALAPVFNLSADEAVARLATAGFDSVDPTQSADTVARANDVTAIRVLAALGESSPGTQPR